MSQPKLRLHWVNDAENFSNNYSILLEEIGEFQYQILISGAEKKSDAYKRAAVKLEALAKEARRLAEEL